jgi:hypothetical protein
VIRGASREAVQAMCDADPTVLSKRGFRYEVVPMLGAVMRA